MDVVIKQSTFQNQCALIEQVFEVLVLGGVIMQSCCEDVATWYEAQVFLLVWVALAWKMAT